MTSDKRFGDGGGPPGPLSGGLLGPLIPPRSPREGGIPPVPAMVFFPIFPLTDRRKRT